MRARVSIMSKFVSRFLTNTQTYVYVCVTIYGHSLILSLTRSLQGSSVEVTRADEGGKQYHDEKRHDITAGGYQAFGQITRDGRCTGKNFLGMHTAPLIR